MKHIKLLFVIFIFLFLITSLSLIIINNIEKNIEKEYKIKFTDYKMIKFEIEEKPAKIIPYEQKTDSRRYIKHIYEHFDKIQKARDKPIRK